MFRVRVAKAVIATLCISTGVLTSEVAHASSLVLSDKVTMVNTLSGKKCSLTSDGETTTYTCHETGSIPPSGQTGSLTITSADGAIAMKNTTSCVSPPTCTFKGTATETDIEKGVTQKPYSATVTGSFKTTTPPPTVNAVARVWESSTAP